MKTLILALAAMLIAAPAVAASAQDTGALHSLPGSYDVSIGPDPNYPDDMNILDDCPYTVGLRRSQDMAVGSICGKAVYEWLKDTGRLSDSNYDAIDALVATVRCGARLILADGNPAKTAADILAAEFDTACGEAPAIM